jgi:hypothetical protein
LNAVDGVGLRAGTGPGLGREAALDALSANASLVERLSTERWLVMRAARDAGASWDQIGTALGTSRQSAWEFLRRKLDEAENASAGT